MECVRLLMSHPNIDKNATYGESSLCALHRCEELVTISRAVILTLSPLLFYLHSSGPSTLSFPFTLLLTLSPSLSLFPFSLILSPSLPLIRAADLGHFLVIQVLSAYGADFTLSTSQQENAIFFAARKNHLIILRLLGQRGQRHIIIVSLFNYHISLHPTFALCVHAMVKFWQ